MADDTCTVTVTDYTGHREGGSPGTLQLQAVSMELTMFEIRELICGQKNDPTITAANTVLYMGKNVLEDKKKLKLYNRSRRTHLALELHDLVQINITVKTLQQCGKGRCVAVPLWAFCCRQKIPLKVPDYQTVGYLRREVANELGDPEGHPAAKIQLYSRGALLDDDLQTLREAGLTDGSTVTVLVRICFFRRKSTDGMQTTDGDTSSRSPGEAPAAAEALVAEAAAAAETPAAEAPAAEIPAAAEAPAAAEPVPPSQGEQPQAASDFASPAPETGGGEGEHHEAAGEAAPEPAETPAVAEKDVEAAGEAVSS